MYSNSTTASGFLASSLAFNISMFASDLSVQGRAYFVSFTSRRRGQPPRSASSAAASTSKSLSLRSRTGEAGKDREREGCDEGNFFLNLKGFRRSTTKRKEKKLKNEKKNSGFKTIFLNTPFASLRPLLLSSPSFTPLPR